MADGPGPSPRSGCDEGGATHRRWVDPRLVVVLVALLAVALAVWRATTAAFTASAGNPKSFATGTVALGDDDQSSAMFNLTGLTPGDTASKCVNVDYLGSLAATVKLHGSLTSGTGLGQYLDLTVERSTGAAGGSTASCAGFSEAGKTTIWTPANGSLDAFLSTHSGWESGADQRSVTGGAAQRVSHRFTVTVQDASGAANKEATVGFTWESRNN